MLRFSCSNCGARLTAREDRAGKAALCPKCGSKIAIPVGPLLIEPKAPPKEIGPATDPQEQNDNLLTSLGIAPLVRHTGVRRYPWPIDVVLYPVTRTGLTCVAVLAATPLLSLVMQVAFGVFCFGGIAELLCRLIVAVYACWYGAECVYDSARGGTRAPDVSTLKMGQSDIGSRITNTVGVYAVYGAPMLIYLVWARHVDAVFWALAAWTVLFLPMGLLAMVMHDATGALNPFLLLRSIRRTLVHYAGLLLLLLGLTAAVAWVLRTAMPASRHLSLCSPIIKMAASGYTALLMSHVLGRFYWRHRDRLDWGI